MDELQATRRVYAVPRRFDLFTLLGVSLFLAVLFSIMRQLRMPVDVTLSVTGFLLLVGAGQAVLFGGRSPRKASVLVGVLTFFCINAYQLHGTLLDITELLLFLSIASLIWGAVLGYLAGTLASGVFLLIDLARRTFGARQADSRSTR